MYSDIIYELLKKELRVRYKHMALGYFWSLASPLTYALLYYIVFKIILKVQIENYPLMLVAGLFPWQWMANSINVGPMTFVGNAPLIKKMKFPRNFIPLVVALQDAIHFVISLPVILFFMWIFNTPLTIQWLWGLPILIVLQFIYSYGLNLLIATVTLFFRDIERLIQLLMTFLFYLTPVLYSEALIPEKYQKFIPFHPLAPLMISWRNLILHGEINFSLILSVAIWASSAVLFAHFVYKKLQWRFAEVL